LSLPALHHLIPTKIGGKLLNDEQLNLAPGVALVKTAIHFEKEEDPEIAVGIEREGKRRNLNTGAFVAVRWPK